MSSFVRYWPVSATLNVWPFIRPWTSSFLKGSLKSRDWMYITGHPIQHMKKIQHVNKHVKIKFVNPLEFSIFLHSGLHRGAGGPRAPAPLRSDAKVPLRSGLCDMNDIVDEISTAAVCVGHQFPGGHHPSCSKKTIYIYICGYKNRPKPTTAFKMS